MAVVKNLMVRVGADLSGLVSGFKKGAGSVGNFKERTKEAMEASAKSLQGIKKAMSGSEKNKSIVSLVDQIDELEVRIRELGSAGFSWGYKDFEDSVLQLRDLKTQLNEYVDQFNQEPDGPKQWVAKLRELQSIQAQLNETDSSGSFERNSQTIQSLNQQIDEFVVGLQKSVDASQPLGVQLSAAKNALREMERVGLGVGDAAWDDMYLSVSRLTDRVNQYKSELESTPIDTDAFVAGIREAIDNAQSLGEKLEIAQISLRELENAGLRIGDAAWDDMYMTVSSLSQEVKDYKAELADVGDNTEQTAQKTSRLGAAARSALGWMKETASKILSIGKHSQSASPGVESLVRSIKRIGIVAVGLKLTSAIFGRFRSIVSSYISENTTLNAKVDALKNSMGQALAPAINLVTNALSALMPYIVGVSNAIGSLITNLFGSGWTTVADGANSAASAIGGAASAQNEFNRTVAGFDEITKLNSESSGGGGGGSSATTTTIEGKTPAWLTSLTDKVKEAFANGDYAGIGKALAEGINTGISWVNESDVSIGAKVASLINDGVSVACGFVENLDWSGLGTAIKTNISDVVTGIDYKQIFKGLGSLAGGIGTTIWSMIGDGLESAKDYFSDSIEDMGGSVASGIMNGIKKGLLNGISWVLDNVMTPFVDGLANAFSGTWLGDNGLGPLADKLNEWSVNIKAIITDVDDRKVAGKEVNVTGNFTFAKDSLPNGYKIIPVHANYTRSTNNLSSADTTFSTKANFTSYSNSLSSTTTIVDATAKVNSWMDCIGNKNLELNANVKKGWTGTLENALGISTVTTKLNVQTPKISVTWKTSSADPSNPGSASTKYPTYAAIWNAKGAILSGAQFFGRIGNTFLGGGEAGREALLPLDRNTWWMDKIADRVARKVAGGQGGVRDLTINLVLDGKVVTRTVVRNINAQARSTGKNPLAAYI